MKSKILCVVIMLFTLSTNAQPPNNTIFFGSVGDGFSRVSNNVASNQIFLGGAGDGFVVASNGIASNDIFRGSVGDGFNFSSNNILSNTIFLGGNGDGFSNTVNTAPSNNIFIGGIGDGWNNALNISASNNIFLGGIGDGWASTFKPQGPLPVKFLYFNARQNSETSSLLEWKTSEEINADRFDVERSNDAVNFTRIGAVKANGNSTIPVEYSFIDNNPEMGVNYYRLKQFDIDGRFVYTPARLVRFSKDNTGDVKFYPNPTNGMLTIETSVADLNKAVVINISNAAGAVVDQFKINVLQGVKIQIDMNRFAKGIYFIQLRSADKNSTQRIILQ